MLFVSAGKPFHQAGVDTVDRAVLTCPKVWTAEQGGRGGQEAAHAKRQGREIYIAYGVAGVYAGCSSSVSRLH